MNWSAGYCPLQRRQVAIEQVEPKTYLERFAVLLTKEVVEDSEAIRRTCRFRMILNAGNW